MDGLCWCKQMLMGWQTRVLVAVVVMGAMVASAGTLTVKDDNTTDRVALESTDSISLQTDGNGDLTLTISGFDVTLTRPASGVKDGDPCTKDGVSGAYQNGLCVIPDGTACVKEGVNATYQGGVCVIPDGTACSKNGADGSYSAGVCSIPDGTACTTSNGGAGSFKNNTCVAQNSGGGVSQGAGYGQYCTGNDENLSVCDPDDNFDPWIAATGERPVYVRDGMTVAIPFTNAINDQVEYGMLQLTAAERRRDRAKEDIFHIWMSASPNGPVLNNDAPELCSWYGVEARTLFYWSQQTKYETQACFLGVPDGVYYVNIETRCYAKYYNVSDRVKDPDPAKYLNVDDSVAPTVYQTVRRRCDDNNKWKSRDTYVVDIARRLK